jgi:hypothetical protein
MITRHRRLEYTTADPQHMFWARRWCILMQHTLFYINVVEIKL